MFLAIVSTVVSSFSPPSMIESAVSEDLQIIQRKELSTIEGRMAFLNNDLAPFIANIDRLNREIQGLSQEIASLDANSQEGQSQIVQLSMELNKKMSAMVPYLPILENMLLLESDLAQLESILEKRDALDVSEENVVKRVASLCQSLNFTAF